MARFPKLVAGRLAERTPEGVPHLSADSLSAFAEKRLGKEDSKIAMKHLAGCAECREVLALSTVNETAPKRIGARFGWWHLRWAAGFAAAGLATLVLWRPYQVQPQPAAKTPAAESAKADARPPVTQPRAQAQLPPTVRKRPPKDIPMVRSVTPAPIAPQPPPPDLESSAALEARDSLSALPEMKEAERARAERPAAEGIARQSTALKLAMRARRQSLWSVEAGPGTLHRSDDNGLTWETSIVDGHSAFLSLSVRGPDVWAGGAGGALFHSVDNGAHWISVVVMDGNAPLKTDIVRLYAAGKRVTAGTKSGVWESADGGETWRKAGGS